MTINIGGKGKEEVAAATMNAIKKATESNQLRLQTLELAMAHLTNICIGLSNDIRSLKTILLQTNNVRGEEKAAVFEMKLPYYSNSNSSSLCSNSKDDLGSKNVKRKTTRKPWKKDPKASPVIKVQGSKLHARPIKANSNGPIKAATNSGQKGSTRSTKAMLVKNKAPARAKASVAQGSLKVNTNDKRLETGTREGQKKPANKGGVKSTPITVEGGGRTPRSSVTVKLPPKMADTPAIHSLIYGSRSINHPKETPVPAITRRKHG